MLYLCVVCCVLSVAWCVCVVCCVLCVECCVCCVLSVVCCVLCVVCFVVCCVCVVCCVLPVTLRAGTYARKKSNTKSIVKQRQKEQRLLVKFDTSNSKSFKMNVLGARKFWNCC